MPGRGVRLAILSAALAACGAEREPDFFVRGVGVIVESAAPFASRADLPGRIEETADAALAYWGGSWTHLEGATISLLDSQYVPCSAPHAIGCYDGDIRVSTRDPSLGTWHCVEQTALVHEVGHAVIGDPEHRDPRWMDFEAVAARLGGRTGWASEGEVHCTLYPSVWRHLHGRR